MTTGPALAPVLGLWGYLLLRHSRRARGRLVLIFNSEAEELREGWQWNYGFELVSLARVFKVIEESSTLTDDNSKTNSCYKRENTNCCLVKQKKQKKTQALCYTWTPSGFHQFCKACFPLGGIVGPSLLWHPPIDLLGAPGEDKSTQIFVTPKVHLRHLPPRWVIIPGSNHILQNENNKETFDQKLGRRWEKRQGGWRTVEVLKDTARVSGVLRNKLCVM